MAQLRAHPRIGAEDRRRPGQHADDVRELPAAGERALENPEAALGSRELVVYLESALLGLHPLHFLHIPYGP